MKPPKKRFLKILIIYSWSSTMAMSLFWAFAWYFGWSELSSLGPPTEIPIAPIGAVIRMDKTAMVKMSLACGTTASIFGFLRAMSKAIGPRVACNKLIRILSVGSVDFFCGRVVDRVEGRKSYKALRVWYNYTTCNTFIIQDIIKKKVSYHHFSLTYHCELPLWCYSAWNIWSYYYSFVLM